ncbi:toxin-antitoxin system YwqK family antitoxin [Variovorax atrisoli]|uniref:toxin-antitoxin system YwqK family antitoxin n=1 Tax=Variovorax atrisoli TaxID=3394203 RepID=UPI00339A6E26
MRPTPDVPARPRIRANAPSTTIEADLNIAEIPYESGAIKFRYARVMTPDKTRWIRHGLFVAYHEHGTVASEGQYVDGKEDGLWRDLHPNGQPAAEGHYRGGQEVGVWRFWKPNGTEEPSTDYGE